ncbi:MAG TPA: S8 family serine peptidase, partial [Actinomycetota bacterium]|nr:S8 family serine peptidase [Actinomycetota bacterium]
MTGIRGPLGAALALVAALSAAVPGGAFGSVPRPGDHRLLVSFEPGADRGAAHRMAGAARLRTLDAPGGWDLVSLPASAEAAAALAVYRRLPGVRAAEPDVPARAASAPDDPCIWTPCAGATQWNMAMIEAPLAWDLFPPATAQERLGADPVLVAVLDSRIDATHPDFSNTGGFSSDATAGGQIDWSSQRSWVAAANRTGPLAWHGTFVAGILAAAGGNAADIAGVAYPALLLPYEVLDGNGRASASAVAEAITAAHRAGARVINLSLGLEAPSHAVRDALIAATSGPAPSLVVAAAGNNTRDEPFYPASYPEAMSVAGVDATGAPASCSNYNDNVSVAAPARAVLSLSPMPGRLRTIDCGTSAAAPHVSGIAALLLARDPSLTPDQVRRIIESTATDDAARPGRDHHLGHGIVNADGALRAAATARVSDVAAAVPPRGASTTRVTAIARSPKGVTGAEIYVDAPGNPAARFLLRPADGAWGGTTEDLVGEVPVPEHGSSVRTLFVRATDGAWGPAARGRLAIDREPPRITNVRADTVVRAQGKRPAVTFTLSDDTSTRLAYTVGVTGPDGVSTVWQSSRRESGAGPASATATAP